MSIRQHGEVHYRAGIMAVVVLGGTVRIGDAIQTQAPPGPARRLHRV